MPLFTTQEEVEAIIRDLKDKTQTQGEELAALKEANQRMVETIEAAGKRGNKEIGLLTRYMDGDKPLLRSVNVFPDGSRRVIHFEDDRSAQRSIRMPGYLDDLNTVDDLQVEIQKLVTDRNIIRQVQRTQAKQTGQDLRAVVNTPFLDARIAQLAKSLPEPLARAFVDSSGSGAEWIPTDVYPEVERAANQLYEFNVPGLFQAIDIQRNLTLPLLLNGFLPHQHGVTGDDPAAILSSSMTTGETATTLKTLAARAQLGADAMEESLIEIMPLAQRTMAEAINAVVEDAIINGDTAATHQDTGLATWNPASYWAAAPGGSSIDHRRAWIGLRAHAVDVSNTVDRSTFSLSTFLLDQANVDGPRADDMVAIFNKLGAAKNLYALSEVTTAYAFGQQATVFKGAATRIAGCDILESPFLTADLNTSGIYDGTTTTKTGAIIVPRSRWINWIRYGVRVVVDEDATRGIVNLVVKTRRDFKPIRASDKSARYLYNMAKS